MLTDASKQQCKQQSRVHSNTNGSNNDSVTVTVFTVHSLVHSVHQGPGARGLRGALRFKDQRRRLLPAIQQPASAGALFTLLYSEIAALEMYHMKTESRPSVSHVGTDMRPV